MTAPCTVFAWCSRPAGHELVEETGGHLLDLGTVEGDRARVTLALVGDDESEYLALRLDDPSHPRPLPMDLSDWRTGVLASILDGLGQAGVADFAAVLKRGADLLNWQVPRP